LRRRTTSAVIFILLTLYLPLPSLGEVVSLDSLNGSIKSLNLHIESPPKSGLDPRFLSSNRFRLDLKGKLLEKASWEFSAEDAVRYASPGPPPPFSAHEQNRIVDMETSWSGGDHLLNGILVDRLNLRVMAGKVEWTLGRQAIGFGRILLFSPLDIIAPFPPDAIDTDIRPGVDAARALYYFGMGGEVGATAVFGKNNDENSYLATFTWNTEGMDLLGIGGSLRKRPMIGLGFAGDVGGMGLRGEGVFYKGNDVGKTGGGLHDDFAVAAVEIDYRFDTGLIVTAEYLYSGAGVKGASDYPKALASPPFREGLAYLAGRHYFLASISYEAHPLVTLNALLISNLQDGSFLVRPLVAVSLSDNASLEIFWNINKGKSPHQVFGVPLQRSEFGAAPDSGGFFLNYYF